MNDDDIEYVEERAAILEYDAGMNRFDAETEAIRLLHEHKQHKEIS